MPAAFFRARLFCLIVAAIVGHAVVNVGINFLQAGMPSTGVALRLGRERADKSEQGQAHVAPVNFATSAGYGSFAVGFVAAGGAMAFAAKGVSSGSARANVAARVGSTAPSLIQVLEQKKLLSTAERLGLLSQAERAGLGIETLEQLGLLKLVEDLKLLTTAENILTNPNTPLLLFVGSGLLGFLAYLDISTGDVSFLQWVLAGALGAPALVLLGAAFVVFAITSGTRRTKDIDLDRVVTTYGQEGFVTREFTESATLLNTLEEKRLLSFVEESRLLSLASSLVNRPLTLTESLGILSTLEKQGLLSTLESQAVDPVGAFKVGGLGLPIIALALFAGFPLGLFLALPGVALIVVGIALGVIAAPNRS